MSLTMLAVLLLGGMALGALFSGYESAWFATNRVEIRGGGRVGVRAAYDLLSRTQTVIYTTLFGSTLCLAAVLYSSHELVCHGAAAYGYRHVETAAHIAVILVLIPIYMIFSVILPRRYFRRNPDSVMLQTAAPVLLLGGAIMPVVRAIRRVSRHAVRTHSNSPAYAGKLSEEDFRQLIEQRKPGDVESIDKRMIFGIFDLEQTIVREIMQPLVNVASLSRTEATREKVVQLAREKGYSRIPVYTSRIVNMDGVIDVLALLRGPASAVPAQYIAEPYYVPESMRADKLLRKMISDRVHLAIVVDEFGGTVGLVTQEDVLEEIVGEIEDEFDPARPTVISQPDGSYLLDGGMDVDDVNERFGTTLPNEDYDRLGGFIYDELGRVPRVGDVVERGRLRVEVLSMDGKQIERVKLHMRAEDEEPEPEENG